MNRNKLFFVLFWVFLFVWLWIYWIFYVIGWDNGEDMQADISDNEEKNEDKENNWQEQKIDLEISEDDEVIIHIPDIFYERWFLNLKEKLESQEWISVKYERHQNIESYKKKLPEILEDSENNDFEADLFLVPSTWASKLEEYAFDMDIQKEVQNSFNHLFSDYFEKDFTFLPFAFEPFTTFVLKNSFREDTNNIESLKMFREFVLSYQDQRILFGITNDIVEHFEEREVYLNNYNKILYYILYSAWLAWDSDIISFFQEIWDQDSPYYAWNYNHAGSYIQRTSRKYEHCVLYPNICMLLIWEYGVSFWFMWELSSYRYFEDFRRDTSDIKFLNFPFEWEYPVRWWGFMINKDSDSLWASLEFLNNYINIWLDGENLFWRNTFSAFNNIFSDQRQDLEYDSLISEYSNFVLTSSYKKYEKISENENLIRALKEEYSRNALIDSLELDL